MDLSVVFCFNKLNADLFSCVISTHKFISIVIIILLTFYFFTVAVCRLNSFNQNIQFQSSGGDHETFK